MTCAQLLAAVAAFAVGDQAAHHGNQIPEGEHMAAGIAMGAALHNGLAVDDAPGPAIQEGAHAGPQNHRQDHTVYGYDRGSIEHMQRLPLFLFRAFGQLPAPAAPPACVMSSPPFREYRMWTPHFRISGIGGRVPLAPFQVGTANPTVSAGKMGCFRGCATRPLYTGDGWRGKLKTNYFSTMLVLPSASE